MVRDDVLGFDVFERSVIVFALDPVLGSAGEDPRDILDLGEFGKKDLGGGESGVDQ